MTNSARNIQYRVEIDQVSLKTRARKRLDYEDFGSSRENALSYFHSIPFPKVRKGYQCMITFREFELKGGFEISGAEFDLRRRFFLKFT